MLLKARHIFINHIIVFIIFSLPITPLFPQNYTVKTFTTKDGLAHNNVRAIAEDSTGFLWIGTWDGLSRYDGYEFKNYYHIPGDTNSISYFSIRNLLVDKNNNIWILTDRSEIVLYDRISDSFKRILGFNDKKQRLIYNIGVDRNGDLWIISQNEILKRNINSGNFTPFKIVNENGETYSWDNIGFYEVDFSANNKVWLIGPKVYELVDKSSNESKGELIIKNIYNLGSPFLKKEIDFEHLCRFSFYESPTGNSWIFSNIGLFKLDKDKAAFCEFRGIVKNDEFIGNRRFDWAWNDGGLYSYDQTTHTTNFYKSETDQLFNSLHHQGKNLIWFSNTTISGTPIGLKRLVFTNSFFKNYLIKEKGNEMSAVFSIVKDQKNVLWAGIKGRDHIVQFTPDNKIKKTGQLTPELFKKSGHIRSMIRVKNGIWIGYFTDLLLFYDFKSGQFVRHFAKENIFRTLAVSKEGNLFIGTENLNLYYPKTGKTELLWKSPENEKIYDLFLDENDISDFLESEEHL